MDLWNEEDCPPWHGALDSYPAVIAAQGVNRLEDLDRWYRAELPGLIAARQPPYVTHEELGQVTAWKMKRGVWRERNRLLVAGNDPGRVEAAAQDAFVAVPDPRRPIALLCGLDGVGPATASGVLAAHSPAIYPFFDELVANQVPDLGPVAFTAAYYARYAEALRQRAAALTDRCPHDPWTAHAVSQALWAASGGKAARP